MAYFDVYDVLQSYDALIGAHYLSYHRFPEAIDTKKKKRAFDMGRRKYLWTRGPSKAKKHVKFQDPNSKYRFSEFSGALNNPGFSSGSWGLS